MPGVLPRSIVHLRLCKLQKTEMTQAFSLVFKDKAASQHHVQLVHVVSIMIFFSWRFALLRIFLLYVKTCTCSTFLNWIWWPHSCMLMCTLLFHWEKQKKKIIIFSRITWYHEIYPCYVVCEWLCKKYSISSCEFRCISWHSPVKGTINTTPLNERRRDAIRMWD